MVINDSTRFGWGSLIHKVSDCAGNALSIIRDVRKLKIKDVMLQALATWGDKNATHASNLPETENMTIENITPTDVAGCADAAIFYRRVRSQMIAERLMGSISSVTQKLLMAKRDLFRWKDATGSNDFEMDGPTILYILMESVNPSTRVGVSDMKETIRETRMHQFDHKVSDMMNDIQTNYNQIVELGYKHDDVVMDTFKALLSTKNEIFKSFVQRMKDAWEMGADTTLNELASTATTKYNNMVKQREWDTKDPKDAKIIALTTKLEAFVNSNGNNGNNSGKSGGGGSGNATNTNKKKTDIPDWRMKKLEDEKVVDGVTWWWCPDHKYAGVFDGLYMQHRPGHEHKLWKEAKDKKREERRNWKERSTGSSATGTKPNPSTGATNDKGNSLKLSDKMKAVLMTKFSCTEHDAMELVSDICQPCLKE